MTVAPVSYWGPLELLDQIKMSDMVSFLLFCPPFPWENQREKALYSTACSHPPSMTRQALPLGSCQLSLVELEPLASQEKVVKLPAESNRPISWVSDWTETEECEAFSLPLTQSWKGCWHSQRCPPLGVTAGPLPSLLRAALLVSLLVSVLTVCFPNLKITRTKTPFKNLFSPLLFFLPFSY